MSNFVREYPLICGLHMLMFLVVPLRDIVLPAQYTSLLQVIQGSSTSPDVMRFVVRLVGVGATVLAIQGMDFLGDYVDTRLLPRLQTYVRMRVLKNIFDRYETNIREVESGELITKLIRLPSVIGSLFERLSVSLVPQIILHVCVVAQLALFVDPFLAVYVAVAVAAVYTVSILTPRRCRDIASQRDKSFSALYEEIDDSLRNMYSVYGAGTKQDELVRLKEASRPYDTWYAKSMRCGFRYRSMTYPVITVFIIVFMTRVFHLAVVRRMQVAHVFLTGMILVNSFMTLDDQLKGIVQEWGVLNSSLEFVTTSDDRPRRTSRPVVQIPPVGTGMMGVQYTYPGRSEPILNGLDLHIQPGEIVLLSGHIGSGKTTIMKLLMGFATPSSGVVYRDGRDCSSMSPAAARAGAAFVPQMPVLFNRTVMENLLYGNKQASQSDAEEFLKRTSLWDIFGDKLHRRIGKNGSELSGGQRQLLWCARVLMRTPRFLLMDEPTASIDSVSKAKLMHMLVSVADATDVTMVIVSHDRDLMGIATRHIVVDGGVIVSDTTPGGSAAPRLSG